MTRRALLLGSAGSCSHCVRVYAERKPPACLIRVSTSARRETGTKVEDASRFLHLLVDRLDPSEASYLGGLNDVESYVRGLLDGDVKYLAVASVVDRCHPEVIIHAFVNGVGSDIPDGEAAMILNENGAFWNPIYAINGLRGGSNLCRTLILLHELSHALGAPGFRPDLDDQTACEANNLMVLRRFPRTFRAMQRLRIDPKVRKENS